MSWDKMLPPNEDLVVRLRLEADRGYKTNAVRKLLYDAANEIESLRQAILEKSETV